MNAHKEPTRRQFLSRAAQGVSGVAVIVTLGNQALVFAQPDAGQAPSTEESRAYNPRDHRYVYLIDVTKCIGCGACVRACEKENEVPRNFFRTWVERYLVSPSGHANTESPDGGKNGFTAMVIDERISKAFFVPKICNHCTLTPCVQLCPVGASFRSTDGVVLVDEKRCIGCSYCVQACPYGLRFIHPETHTASKCTLCYHRITKGLPTACVQACPVGARQFGDSKKLHDKVSEIIATSQVFVLKPELMTEPDCYYIGLSREVR